MSELPTEYTDLVTELRQIGVLRSCSAVLGWDEQTYLPAEGAGHRAEQLALLAGMSHERATSSRLGMSYMTGSSTSSMIARRPRAPVPRWIA